MEGRLQEGKMDRWKIETRIGDETTPPQEKPPSPEQLQIGRKTPVNSVQLKIRAFTQKFNIPPNETKPPPPPENFSEQVSSSEYGRRPRQNKISANEYERQGPAPRAFFGQNCN